MNTVRGETVRSFESFSFVLRFDRQRIVAVPHSVQLERVAALLLGLGRIHPLFERWYRQGASTREALAEPLDLQEEARSNHDAEYPDWLRVSLWNGQEDPLAGGLALHYSAHGGQSLTAMRFENGGAIVAAVADPGQVAVDILQLALSLWPEIDWAVLAPRSHYLRSKAFKDHQSVGWIGFCPHALTASDIPEAHQVIDVPGRGSLIVSCPTVMGLDNPDDVRRVARIDERLMALGYLPLFLS